MVTLCRLCSISCQDGCNLFGDSPLLDSQQLLNNIKLYTGVDIQAEDFLPTMVCWNCVQKVAEIEVFVNLCREAQEKLEFLVLKDIKIKEEGIFEDEEADQEKPFEKEEYDKSFEDFSDPSKMLQQQLSEFGEEKTSTERNTTKVEQVKYCCPVCAKEFVEKSSIRKHLEKIHDDSKQELYCKVLDEHEVPKCKTCGEVCNNHFDLLTHSQKHKSTVCPNTVWHIRHKSALSIAKLQAATKRNFSEEEQAAYQKLIDEGKDQELYCTLFGNIFAIVPHSKRETRHWICKQCDGESFFGKCQDFEAHFNSHSNPTVCFTCELCLFTEPTLQRFQAHLKKRHFIDVQCEHCGEIFQNKATLAVHKVRVHNIDYVKCPYCEKTYSSEHNLKPHISRVHENNTFVCHVCAKPFKSQESCKAHEKTHLDITYNCEYCNNVYKCKARLKSHIKLVHTTTYETYSCERCGKVFNERRKLNHHMKIHDGHPDLTCDICGKVSYSKFSAKQHKDRVHFKIKNFQCSLCPFASAAKDKLQLHVKKVHENEHDTCFVCYRQVKHLYHHVRQAHKDGPALWDQYMKSKQEPVKIIDAGVPPLHGINYQNTNLTNFPTQHNFNLS